ncbi:MAG: ABC transporter permease [Aquabacterium sp.]
MMPSRPPHRTWRIGRIPVSYIARNLWTRRMTTLLTAGGMALVAYVFAVVLMMSEGIRDALVATGEANNLIVLSKGADTEVNSTLSRQQAAVLASLPEIAADAQGQRLASAEVVVLHTLPKSEDGTLANVTMRGTSGDLALTMRPRVRLIEGRMFKPGTQELVVGRGIVKGFANVEVGRTLSFSGREWPIVGVIDAGGSGFDSEIWGDAESILAAFKRGLYASVLLHVNGPASEQILRERIERDPRLLLDVHNERRFYATQSETMSRFIWQLGMAMSGIFSIGAIVGAMITMYAAVAQRTAEIGTLRALGFRRGAILLAFLGESLLLSLSGGLVGLAAAMSMQHFKMSTTNLQTFSEIAFTFHLTPMIALRVLAFAAVMGVVGGVLPAWRAARLTIVDGLRAV